MRNQEEINKKISETLKSKFAEEEHWHKGKKTGPYSDERKRKISEGMKAYRASQPKLTKEQKRARNLAKTRAYQAKRIGAITETTDLALIRRIYDHRPEGYHVDHIIGLKAGGKHHQDNLQYLPASENSRKGKGIKYDESLVIRWQDVVPDD